MPKGVEVADDGGTEEAHGGHGDPLLFAPAIDGRQEGVAVAGRGAQQLGDEFAFAHGIGGFGSLAAGGHHAALVRNGRAFAEDFHGQIPHRFEAQG